MKRFLVVDDSHERKEQYIKVFNFLELDFAFSKKEFLEKIKLKYDGFFIDVIYTEQQYEEFSFQQVLEHLPNKKPLFIISEHWASAMDGIKMQYLVKSEKYTRVLGYLSWNIIEAGDVGETVKDFVRQQINNYFKMAYDAFGEEQDITILQISDIEFGNPGQEENIELAREVLKSRIRKILKKLNVNTGKVDFICVCGDIAYKGEKDEYNKAKQWFKLLGGELLMNENYQNMLFVPGNHDFCFSAAAGNYYVYDKELHDYKERDEGITLEYNEHGMYNFAKFVYEMNGEKSYIFEPYKPIVKRTYEEYGINFILLNPIKIGADKKFKYGLSDTELKYLVEVGNEMEGKEVCNIILSHLAADKYSMVDSSSSSTNKDIRSIVNELNIKGWFEGHAHDDAYIDDIRIGDHKVLISRTEPLMLKNKEHCEGGKNGFTVFKLSREKGKVVNISYYDENKEKEVEYRNLFE